MLPFTKTEEPVQVYVYAPEGLAFNVKLGVVQVIVDAGVIDAGTAVVFDGTVILSTIEQLFPGLLVNVTLYTPASVAFAVALVDAHEIPGVVH